MHAIQCPKGEGEEEEEEEEGEEEEAMAVVLSRLLIALVSSRARSSRAISTSPPAMVADTLLYHLIFGQRIGSLELSILYPISLLDLSKPLN